MNVIYAYVLFVDTDATSHSNETCR